MTTPYLALPLCLDDGGHRFRIDSSAGPNRACCERCGLIRVTPPSHTRWTP
jgi:hypothetical protein